MGRLLLCRQHQPRDTPTRFTPLPVRDRECRLFVALVPCSFAGHGRALLASLLHLLLRRLLLPSEHRGRLCFVPPTVPMLLIFGQRRQWIASRRLAKLSRKCGEPSRWRLESCVRSGRAVRSSLLLAPILKDLPPRNGEKRPSSFVAGTRTCPGLRLPPLRLFCPLARNSADGFEDPPAGMWGVGAGPQRRYPNRQRTAAWSTACVSSSHSSPLYTAAVKQPLSSDAVSNQMEGARGFKNSQLQLRTVRASFRMR